jgi:hypothetical protein
MRYLSFILATIVVFLATDSALAQRSAGSKMLGTAYEGWSGGMYQDHAYDHMVVLQNYANSDERVPQEVARRHLDAVRSNLTAASKSYARLAAKADDKAAAAKHVAAIAEHHAKAMAQCAKIDAEVAKGGDAGAVRKCCTDASGAIQAAQAEHEKMMKNLKLAPPKPAA